MFEREKNHASIPPRYVRVPSISQPANAGPYWAKIYSLPRQNPFVGMPSSLNFTLRQQELLRLNNIISLV